MESVLNLGCSLESPGFQNHTHQVLLQINEIGVSGDGAKALVQLKSCPSDAKVQPGPRATVGLDPI